MSSLSFSLYRDLCKLTGCIDQVYDCMFTKKKKKHVTVLVTSIETRQEQAQFCSHVHLATQVIRGVGFQNDVWCSSLTHASNCRPAARQGTPPKKLSQLHLTDKRKTKPIRPIHGQVKTITDQGSNLSPRCTYVQW